MIIFKDFPGLENKIAEIKDFQGFQGPVRTLYYSDVSVTKQILYQIILIFIYVNVNATLNQFIIISRYCTFHQAEFPLLK